MNKFIYIAIFFIFQSFVLGTNYNGITTFENTLNENQDFIENGVKLVYTSNLSEKTIKEALIIEINKNFLISFKYCDNTIEFEDNNIKYTISIWSEKNTKVSIQAINKSRDISIGEVLDKIEKLNIKGKKENEYKYIKYKIIEPLYNYEELILKDAEKINEIDIYNGKVTKVKLSDDTIITLAHMQYNSGNYLIIGTPMIFVTY